MLQVFCNGMLCCWDCLSQNVTVLWAFETSEAIHPVTVSHPRKQHHCENLKSHAFKLNGRGFLYCGVNYQRPQTISCHHHHNVCCYIAVSCYCCILVLYRCILFASWHLRHSCYLHIQWIQWQSNMRLQPRLPRWWNSVHTNRCVCRSHL